MRPTRLFTLLPAMTLAVALTGCGDDAPYSAAATLYDIVTYGGSVDGVAIFAMRASNDSPLLTLTATGVDVDPAIGEGDRMLLGYIPASGVPYTSGEVSVVSMGAINNVPMKEDAIADIRWDADPIYLNSIWRTGCYINVYCRVSYSAKPRLLLLVADRETLGDPVPQLYLVHDLLGEPDSYTRRAYLSADISDVWRLETCRGVTVHVADSNLPTTEYTFMKTDN
ncbi:MAG: hypothetical protein K1V84_01485 [Muribaculaceae bacterium]